MAGRKLSDAITSPKSTMLTKSFFLFDRSKIFSGSRYRGWAYKLFCLIDNGSRL